MIYIAVTGTENAIFSSNNFCRSSRKIFYINCTKLIYYPIPTSLDSHINLPIDKTVLTQPLKFYFLYEIPARQCKKYSQRAERITESKTSRTKEVNYRSPRGEISMAKCTVLIERQEVESVSHLWQFSRRAEGRCTGVVQRLEENQKRTSNL